MKKLLAQKGCHATLLHNGTWSLTLPNAYTLELCFNSEIELCDFLGDLPDMNPVPSTLHARGYISQRSNTLLTSSQTLNQQSQVPPVNINLRAIRGLQENHVPKKTQQGSKVISADLKFDDVAGSIVILSIITMFTSGGVIPQSASGWFLLLGYVVGQMLVPVSAGVIGFYLFPNAKNRLTVSVRCMLVVFLLVMFGKFG